MIAQMSFPRVIHISTAKCAETSLIANKMLLSRYILSNAVWSGILKCVPMRDDIDGSELGPKIKAIWQQNFVDSRKQRFSFPFKFYFGNKNEFKHGLAHRPLLLPSSNVKNSLYSTNDLDKKYLYSSFRDMD